MTRIVTILVGLTVVGLGTAWVVLKQLDQLTQAWIATLTAGGCLIGALVALEIIRRAAKVDMSRVAASCLGGMTFRLGISVLTGTVIVLTMGASVRLVALWTLGWYLLLLAVEVRLLATCFGRSRTDYSVMTLGDNPS